MLCRKNIRHVTLVGDLVKWFPCHTMFLESDLIAVGTLVNTEPKFFHMEKSYGFVSYLLYIVVIYVDIRNNL